MFLKIKLNFLSCQTLFLHGIFLISLPLILITQNSLCDFRSIGFNKFSHNPQLSVAETGVSSDDRVLSPLYALRAAVSRTDCGRRSGACHLGGNPSLEAGGEVSIVSSLKRRLCCFSPGFSFILDTRRGKQSLARIDSRIYSRTGCGGESHL